MDKVIRIQIGKGIRYKNLPKKVKEKIFTDLTIKNPKYEEAIQQGRWVGHNISSHLYFFAVSRDKKIFWTPRGYFWHIKRYLNENKYQVKIDDRTLTLPQIDVTFQGTLRPYQKGASVDMVTRYPQGVLEAATGSGKTVIACDIIAKRKQPTLIIVHNKELLYQWQGAIKKFLNYDCGLIGDSKFDVRPITVGIINTVRNKVEQLSDKFGHVICDEAHRSPAAIWMETLVEFPAKFYLGLSATPWRRDGLGKAINIYIGHKIHIVDKKMLHSTGAVLKPIIKLVSTDFNYMYRDDYSKMVSTLCKDYARNGLIVHSVYDDFKKYRQNILIVSDRKNHCAQLQYQLKNQARLKSQVLTGSVSSKKRLKIIEDIKNGECNILIATLSLIGEGFDCPDLSALFLTTPIKFSGRLIQVVGRILRPKKNKVPRVYDFRDNNVHVLKYQGINRSKTYIKNWQ